VFLGERRRIKIYIRNHAAACNEVEQFLDCVYVRLRRGNVGLHKNIVGSVNGNYHKNMLRGEEDVRGSSEIVRWGIDKLHLAVVYENWVHKRHETTWPAELLLTHRLRFLS
jgi:hypothetical protein